MATLTPAESETLQEFRRLVSDILKPKHDDAFLLRWLRARRFKLEDAEDMLRKSMAWREKFEVDTILETYNVPEVLKLYWPLAFLACDKDGFPVWMFRYGNTDFKGVIYSARTLDVNMFYIYLLEQSELKMEEQTKKLGKLVDCHTYIFDMENFALQQMLWKPAFDLISNIVAFYEDNYPERLKRVYAINAPAVFYIAFALLKPFFSESTYKKIRIFGKGGWKEELLQFMDADDIPVHWGGTKTGPDGDPYCTNLIPCGGTVPKSYYLQESQSLSSEIDILVLDIKVKSIRTVEVYVQESDSVLEWEFKTDKHDIGFGVYYQQDEYNENDLIEVVPTQRVNCHLVPETGTLVCENEGTYVLKFDNSFSYLRSKTVRLRKDVIPPATKL